VHRALLDTSALKCVKMDRKEALRILGLESSANGLTASQLRKHYLRRALDTHPDKHQGDRNYNREFTDLKEAHDVLLQEIKDGEAAAAEASHTEDLLSVLVRALKGENVELELRNLGVHRPSDMFGIDLTVPFERWPRDAAASDVPHEHGSPVRIDDAFKEAFREDGLDDEGNPLEGWARPPVVDLEDL